MLKLPLSLEEQEQLIERLFVLERINDSLAFDLRVAFGVDASSVISEMHTELHLVKKEWLAMSTEKDFYMNWIDEQFGQGTALKVAIEHFHSDLIAKCKCENN